MVGANVCQYFDIEQIFTLGIGFDVAGAVLVVRGLLASPRDIARRTASYYGYNAWATVSEASDRVDGVIGVAALTTGFAVQAAGYVALLGHKHEEHARFGKALVAVGAALLGIVIVTLVWRTFRRALLKRTLREASRYALDQAGERLELPLGARLQAFGEAMGEPVRNEEDAAAYLRRVFGVDDAFFGERPFWRLSEGPPPPPA